MGSSAEHSQGNHQGTLGVEVLYEEASQSKAASCVEPLLKLQL